MANRGEPRKKKASKDISVKEKTSYPKSTKTHSCNVQEQRVIDEAVPDTPVDKTGVEWEFPVFAVDKEFAEFHNKLATEHSGNQVCWQQSKLIQTMAAIVRQYNSSVELKLKVNIKKGKIDPDRVPQAIEGLVKSYANSMQTHCNEAYTKLDMDIRSSYDTGKTTNGDPFIEAMFVKLIQIRAINRVEAVPSQRENQIAVTLPKTIKDALGLKDSELLEFGYPDVLKKIKMMEQYIEYWGSLISRYAALQKYTYDGPIPESVMKFEGSDEPPEVVNWSTEVHTVEV